MMDKIKYKEKEFNLEGSNADKKAQEFIDKNSEDCDNERQKFNRYEFVEYSIRAVENCNFLKSFYIQKYQKSKNLGDAYCAFMARYVSSLIVSLNNPTKDNDNIPREQQITLEQQNYIEKKLEKERDCFMKNIISGSLQIAYQPYVKQTLRKIMNNYAHIKQNLLPQKKNINYGQTIKIINEDIKKFLGIDMEGIKNNKIKVDYNNITEHLVTENHSLEIIEKIHKEIENVAKRRHVAYNAYQNIDSNPCDNKLRMWGMEKQLRENIDKESDPTRRQVLNEALKNLQEGRSVDIRVFGD